MVKHELYARNKDVRKRIARIADGLMATLEEYMDKAAADEDKAVRDLAMVELGRRLNPSCGSCFYLPPLDDL